MKIFLLLIVNMDIGVKSLGINGTGDFYGRDLVGTVVQIRVDRLHNQLAFIIGTCIHSILDF